MRGLRRVVDYRTVIGMVIGALVMGVVTPIIVDRGSGTTAAATPGALSVGSAGSQPTSGVSAGVGPPGANAALAATSGQASAAVQNGTATASTGPAGHTTAPSGMEQNSSASGPLPASDQGVTGTTIKVGIPIQDGGALAASGAAATYGTPAERQRIWQAIIDAQNRAGGADGRKIVPDYAVYQAISAQDERPAVCERFARDDRVFFVMADTAWDDGSCLAIEHGIPIEVYEGAKLGTILQSKGLIFQSMMTPERIVYTHVLADHQHGNLTGKKIGIVSEQGQVEVDKVEVPLLKQLGYTVTHHTTLSTDTGTAQSQIPVEVNQMRLSGVDFILWEAGVLNSNTWLNEANKQGYYPKYSMDDEGSAADDFGLQGVQGRVDAIAWGARKKYMRHGHYVEDPADAQCRKTIEAGAGTSWSVPMDTNHDLYWEVLRYCGMLTAFVNAANSVGPNLTRRSVADAMSRLGPMPYYDVGPNDHGGSFGPNKWDAPDYLLPLKAADPSQCPGMNGNPCWIPSGDWFPVPAYAGPAVS